MEDITKRKNYYFTFGSKHVTNNEVKMQHYWVRVIAHNFEMARHIFIHEFTFKQMPNPNNFAFQYEEENFKPEFCVLGEYKVIHQT